MLPTMTTHGLLAPLSLVVDAWQSNIRLGMKELYNIARRRRSFCGGHSFGCLVIEPRWNEVMLERSHILACFTKGSCRKKGHASLILLQMGLDNISQIVDFM